MNILTTSREEQGLELLVDSPVGIQQMADWGPFEVEGATKTLILSDVHIPYQDKAAVDAAVKLGRQFGADTILLNGDLMDFYQVSRYLRSPRANSIASELKITKGWLEWLRGQFPKARIVYKLGNHEERWENYILARPEMFGLEALELKSLMNLEPLGITIVGDKRPIYLGELAVIHGHEYAFAISNPVNAARGFFLRAKVHCLGGHLHQSSEHSERNLRGETTATWSTGCLCELHPKYAPLNRWNHGFAMVETDKSGKFRVENLKIINGKVY